MLAIIGSVGIISIVNNTAMPSFIMLGVFLMEKKGANDINDVNRANIKKPHGKLSHPGTSIPP
jgi:hypothetical protein